MSSGIELVRAYLAALSRWAPSEELADFFHDDAKYVEYPNRLAPNGNRRDKAALLAAFAKGKALLRTQAFALTSAIEKDGRVAAEVAWKGTLAIAFGELTVGDELMTHSAMIFEIRDGKIASQTNYDCVDPW
jgi:ketosteroid isomerase-like protein